MEATINQQVSQTVNYFAKKTDAYLLTLLRSLSSYATGLVRLEVNALLWIIERFALFWIHTQDSQINRNWLFYYVYKAKGLTNRVL